MAFCCFPFYAEILFKSVCDAEETRYLRTVRGSEKFIERFIGVNILRVEVETPYSIVDNIICECLELSNDLNVVTIFRWCKFQVFQDDKCFSDAFGIATCFSVG